MECGPVHSDAGHHDLTSSLAGACRRAWPGTRTLNGELTANACTIDSRRHRDAVTAANPYPWPYDGDLQPSNTALIVIDMQTDFCGKGGYVDKMGYDLSLTRAPIEPIRRVLAAMREGLYDHAHARRSPPRSVRSAANKRWRSQRHRRRHRRSRPVWPHLGSRRAGLGDHFRAGAAARRDRSSTSRARARSTPPISNCCCTAGNQKRDPDRHHHRRLRPHDHARRQRSRFRVLVARRLLRRHRNGNHRAAAENGHHAGRRVRRRRSLGGSSGGSVHDRDDVRLPAPSSRPTFRPLRIRNRKRTCGRLRRRWRRQISKRFGSLQRSPDVSLTSAPGVLPRCSARTAPAKARS